MCQQTLIIYAAPVKSTDRKVYEMLPVMNIDGQSHRNFDRGGLPKRQGKLISRSANSHPLAAFYRDVDLPPRNRSGLQGASSTGLCICLGHLKLVNPLRIELECMNTAGIVQEKSISKGAGKLHGCRQAGAVGYSDVLNPHAH